MRGPGATRPLGLCLLMLLVGVGVETVEADSYIWTLTPELCIDRNRHRDSCVAHATKYVAVVQPDAFLINGSELIAELVVLSRLRNSSELMLVDLEWRVEICGNPSCERPQLVAMKTLEPEGPIPSTGGFNGLVTFEFDGWQLIDSTSRVHDLGYGEAGDYFVVLTAIVKWMEGRDSKSETIRWASSHPIAWSQDEGRFSVDIAEIKVDGQVTSGSFKKHSRKHRRLLKSLRKVENGVQINMQ